MFRDSSTVVRCYSAFNDLRGNYPHIYDQMRFLKLFNDAISEWPMHGSEKWGIIGDTQWSVMEEMDRPTFWLEIDDLRAVCGSNPQNEIVGLLAVIHESYFPLSDVMRQIVNMRRKLIDGLH